MEIKLDKQVLQGLVKTLVKRRSRRILDKAATILRKDDMFDKYFVLSLTKHEAVMLQATIEEVYSNETMD